MTHRFLPKTLKAQLLFYGTLAVLIAGALVGWLDFRTADADARREMQAHMLKVSTALVSALERVGLQQGQEILDAFQRDYGAKEGSEALIVDPQGRIIAASRRASIGKSVEEAMGHPEPEVAQVLAGQLPQAQTEMTYGGVPVFDLTLALHGDPTDPARVTGALHYAEPYTAYTDLLQQSLLRFLLSELLLVVLLIAPFWLFLERRVLHPVRRIVEADRALAQGRWEGITIPASAIPDNEIGEIARSRAEMLARLETVQAQERLAKLNECLLSFGADPDENINRLVAFCGEQLQATCALYNRLEGDRLHALGQWHTPPDFNPVDKPDGHICYDVIQSPRDDIHVIRDLPHTGYAQTDPNVVRYELRTYVGKAVSLEGAFVGSLCVVYQDDRIPSEDDLNLLGIAASAVGVEEKRKRAEEALGQLKQFNEDIVQRMAEGIVVEDAQGNFTLANPAAAVMLGYAPEEMIGRHWTTIVPPDQQPVVQAADTRRARGESDRYEIELMRKDGTRRSVIVSGSPRLESGHLIGMIAVFTDITARKQAEEERERLLREAETLREAAVALLEITQVSGSSLELKQVLKHIAQRTAEACQANRCTIFLLDEAGEYLQPVMSQFANGHADLEQWQVFKVTTADRVDIVPLFQAAVRERRPVLLEDAARTDLVPLKWTQPFGIQKLLAVPLVSRDRTIGLMALDHTEASREFTTEQIDLALTIGGQVAASIENARLYTEMQQELVERKRAEETLRRRDAILEAISFAAARFLKAPSWQENIQQVLERLGQATGVSRIYIFENQPSDAERGDRLTSQRYEWVAPGILPQIDNPDLQSFPLCTGGSARWEETLGRGELVYGHVREFPESERAVLAPQDIQSIAVVPIFVGQTWWGFIGFDECRAEREWSAAERDALKTAADTLGAALQRQQADETLRTRERHLTLLNDIVRAAAGTLDFREMLQVFADRLGELFNADGCYITLWDHARQLTIPYAAYGPLREIYPATRAEPGEVTMTESVVRASHALIAEDVFNSPYVSPHIAAQFPAGSLLGLPLIAGDQKLGAALIAFNQPHHFTADEIARGEHAAGQIALAIAKARLFEAERRAREKAEFLRQAAHAISGSLKLEQVLRLLLEQLKRVLTYDTASVIMLREGEQPLLVSGTGYTDEKTTSQAASNLLKTSPILSQMARNLKPITIADVREHPGWIWVPGAEHIRSFLAVPIIHQGQMIGALMADSVQFDFFKEDDAQHASSLAQHISVALNNAQLFESVERKADQLATLRKIDRTLNSLLDLEPMLEAILDAIALIVPYDQAVVLLLEGETLHAVAARGNEKAQLIHFTLDISNNSIFQHMVRERTAILIADVRTEPNWATVEGVEAERAWLGAPLIAREKIIGQIGLFSATPGAFTHEHSQLLMAFADHTAIAIANAQLRAELNDQARRDSMTQILNHGTLIDELKKAGAQAALTQIPLSLIMLDLDDFKIYNDKYGHVIGDQVIVAAVQAIRKHIKSTDLVGRWGGEEFSVALIGADTHHALRVAERIRTTLAETVIFDSHQIQLPPPTVSQGIATLGVTAHTVDELIDRADRALYRAKNRGKDQVVVAE